MVLVLPINTIVLLAIFSTVKSIPFSEIDVSSPSPSIPDDHKDILLPETEKTFYIGTFFKATWHVASKYCRHRGMFLASINSEKEQHDLEATIDRYGTLDLASLWISGTNVNKYDAFVWSNGRIRTSMAYTNWYVKPAEQSSSRLCVRMLQGNAGYGWDTTDCANSFYFVCEIFDARAYSEYCNNTQFP